MSNMHQNFCPCCGKPLHQQVGPYMPLYPTYPSQPGSPLLPNPYNPYSPCTPIWNGAGAVGSGFVTGGSAGVTQNSVN